MVLSLTQAGNGPPVTSRTSTSAPLCVRKITCGCIFLKRTYLSRSDNATTSRYETDWPVYEYTRACMVYLMQVRLHRIDLSNTLNDTASTNANGLSAYFDTNLVTLHLCWSSTILESRTKANLIYPIFSTFSTSSTKLQPTSQVPNT